MFVEVNNGYQIHQTLTILVCYILILVLLFLGLSSSIISILSFFFSCLDCFMKINKLLTEVFKDSIKVSLALVVLVNHEHATLLIMPFHVRF